MEAVQGEEVVGTETVERSITLASILWMPFTYYTSIFLYRAYPDEIEINVVKDRTLPLKGKPAAVWKDEDLSAPRNNGSVWEKPLY